MAETVSTGGTRDFHYGKDYNPKLKAKEKEEIKQAYGKYYERKAKEKRNKTLIIIAIILIAIVLGFLLF